MAEGIGSATVTSDEDMQSGFVLVDEHAPTAEAARDALIRSARVEWDVRFLDESQLTADMAERRSYKWEGQENLVLCDDDDLDRDSEWWWFSLPDWDWTRNFPAAGASAGGS